MGADSHVQIPGFTIERELGRGAMGVVYLAHEIALGRDVALKVLRHGYGGDEDARLRFAREVRATARLKHPNIVPILSTGESDGRLWFAMQFVPGETLEDILEHTRHGRIGTARAVRVARELALALHAAHQSGVTHRDVKPGNVMLLQAEAPESENDTPSRRMRRSWIRRRPEGGGHPLVDRPLLADFGLAADRTATKLSESGMLIGTPGYMAPEQYRGEADGVGPHSDQWALGVLLYECLTGTMPFPTGDLPTLARMIGNEEPIAPSRLDTRVDRDLETICLKCLEKNPKDRYADCRRLAADLSHWLREEPISARPPGAWRRFSGWARRHPARTTALAALVVVGLGALGAWWGVRANRQDRVQTLSGEAGEYMARAQYEQAERVFDEWITVDPADPRPRDLRETARALRGMEGARRALAEAEAGMGLLTADRERLAVLVAQAKLGKAVEGGKGLGTENARGSEPWWMRQASYEARREMEKLRAAIAERAATVGRDLSLARSQAAHHLEKSGADGARVHAQIVGRSGRWHLAEWRHAIENRDARGAAMHRAAARTLLAGDEAVEVELRGERLVRILPADPPGDAWLFRYEREGDVLARGGPRLLPLPFHPTRERTSIAAAYEASLAARLEGEGRRRVAPDVPALTRPLRSDEQRLGTLDGPMLRTRYQRLLADSAYPLVTSASNALGRIDTPLELALRPGRYLVLVRRAERPDLRVSFEVQRGPGPPVAMGEDMELLQVPEGFCLIPGGEVLLGSEDDDAPGALPRQRVPVRAFLAARYEVTYGDWWEFLNDPRTLSITELLRNPPPPQAGEAPPAPELRFVPRSEGGGRSAPDAALPEGPPTSRYWQPMDGPEHPATHVCLYDLAGYLTPPEGEDEPHDYQYEELADALRESRTVGWGYLRWRTERSLARARAAAAGGPVQRDVAVIRGPGGKPIYCALRFTLPTQPEWERMARGGDRRVFAYGDEREWLHFKGEKSRPHNAAPEPVGLFPDDESVYGVRDLTGSVAEWTADWDGEGRVFWVKGGAWSSQEPEQDRIAARRALAPTAITSIVGIRLIVRVLEPVDAP